MLDFFKSIPFLSQEEMNPPNVFWGLGKPIVISSCQLLIVLVLLPVLVLLNNSNQCSSKKGFDFHDRVKSLQFTNSLTLGKLQVYASVSARKN